MDESYILRPYTQVVDDSGVLVVINRRTGSGHRLTGTSAEAVRIVRSGGSQEAVEREVLDALVANGVLAVRDQALLPHVTRRQALAAAAAVGISTLALPQAAAAASPGGGVGPEGEGGGGYGPYSEVDFYWDAATGTADSGNWSTYQEYYSSGAAPTLETSVSSNRASVRVPTGHSYMEITVVGGNGGGGGGYYGGSVFARFMVQAGDTIQAIAGPSAAAGGGSFQSGGVGGRGVGVYRQGASATTGTWIVIAGGSGGSLSDSYSAPGYSSINQSEADGKPQTTSDVNPLDPNKEEVFRLSGKGGKGAITALGAGGAGGEAAGAVVYESNPAPGSAGSAGSNGSGTLGSNPMSLAAGGSGGTGAPYTPSQGIGHDIAGSTGGSGGGSGYRGGGGGGGSGSGYTFGGPSRNGGGGGAGASYVNEAISATGWSYVAESANYGASSGPSFRITFYTEGFPE